MSRQRTRALIFYGTLLLSLMLMIMPLPAAITPFKPYWPALVLIYWALETTDRVSIGLAFSMGIAADLINGVLLGEQALRLAVIVFIVLRFRPRLRFFPMWQQVPAVLALLLNDRVLQLAIRAFAGEAQPPLAYWGAPFVGALLWPFVFLILDDLRARLRLHEA
jgi:rod shape-determining protein MreD